MCQTICNALVRVRLLQYRASDIEDHDSDKMNNSPCSTHCRWAALQGCIHSLHPGMIILLQLRPSLIRLANGRALLGAAGAMLKLLLPTGQSNS